MNRAFLPRVISYPPTDPRVTEFRQEIFAELASVPLFRRRLGGTRMQTPLFSRGLTFATWRVILRHMAAKSYSLPKPMSGGNRYAAELLGLSKTDPVSLAAAVRAGLDYSTFTWFSRETKLSGPEVCRVIKVKERTLDRRKTEGRLQPEESDRLLRISRVFALAIDLFEGDRNAAKQWLETPQRALAGSTPLTFAESDVGAREVESLIGRLEHGVGV